MFCQHVFGNISSGFRIFLGILRKYLNFAGPRPSEISEALLVEAIIREFFVNLEGIFPDF